jgi:hypothetical protein
MREELILQHLSSIVHHLGIQNQALGEYDWKKLTPHLEILHRHDREQEDKIKAMMLMMSQVRSTCAAVPI